MMLLSLPVFWACSRPPATEPPPIQPEGGTETTEVHAASQTPETPAVVIGHNGLPRNHIPPRPFHQPRDPALIPVSEATQAGDATLALQLLEPMTTPPVSAEVDFFMGRALILSRDFEGALPHLQHAIQSDPPILQAHKELAGAQLSIRQMPEAETQINIYLQHVDDDAEAWFMRSFCRKYRGDIQGALDDAQRACALEMEKACQVFNFLEGRLSAAEASPSPPSEQATP